MTPAQAYTYLYSGPGYVYVTGLSGTFPAPAYEFGPYAFPSTGYANVPFNRTVVENWGRTSVPDNADSYATFSINITTAVASNCTAVTVGGVNQVVTFAMVAGNAAASAQAMAAAINSFVSVAPDYSAIAVGTMVIGRCNVAGSTPNGGAVSLTFSAPGNVYTTTPVAGGRAAGESAVRIWLDIDPLATETTPTANIVEITDWVHHQGFESPTVVVDGTVGANILTVPRMASLMRVNVSGPSALRTLNLEGAVAGDEVELVGVTGFPCDVESGAGNIVTSNAATVPLTGPSTRISVVYSLAGGGTWNESARSARLDATELRATGVAVPLVEGYETVSVPGGGGTYQILPGNPGPLPPNSTNKNSVKLSGTVALAGNYSIVLDTTTSIAGDSGIIYGGTSAVTLGAFSMSVTIGVQTFTIPSQTALQGGWVVSWLHDGVSAAGSFSPNFSGTGFIDTAMIAPAAITNPKIAPGIDGAKLLSGTVVESALSVAVVAKLNAVADIGAVTLNNFNCVNGTTYFADATVGNLTGTLPNVATASYMRVTVVKTDASVNTVTVQGDANINGAVSYVLAAQYDSVSIASNGTEWFVVAAMP